MATGSSSQSHNALSCRWFRQLRQNPLSSDNMGFRRRTVGKGQFRDYLMGKLIRGKDMKHVSKILIAVFLLQAGTVSLQAQSSTELAAWLRGLSPEWDALVYMQDQLSGDASGLSRLYNYMWGFAEGAVGLCKTLSVVRRYDFSEYHRFYENEASKFRRMVREGTLKSDPNYYTAGWDRAEWMRGRSMRLNDFKTTR